MVRPINSTADPMEPTSHSPDDEECECAGCRLERYLNDDAD